MSGGVCVYFWGVRERDEITRDKISLAAALTWQTVIICIIGILEHGIYQMSDFGLSIFLNSFSRD